MGRFDDGGGESTEPLEPEQNKTKQNKTKQNKTKQNKTFFLYHYEFNHDPIRKIEILLH